MSWQQNQSQTQNRNRTPYAPLNGNDGRGYGTNQPDLDEGVAEQNPMQVEGEGSLVSFSRLYRSFFLSQSSKYIVSSCIVALVVCGALTIILFLTIARILDPSNPYPGGRKYVDPLVGFDHFPDQGSLRSHLKYITKQEHLAGKGKPLSDWMKQRFQYYGLKTEVHTYYPYLNYPVNRRLAIIEPKGLAYEAKLLEEVVPGDDTSKHNNVVPTFHGLSKSGNVTGKLIYANYGTWDDFQLLKSKGVQIAGHIALVKYGKCFRGLKVRAAELHGAIGVIIYSDPADDGFVKGKVYPEGPYRPKSGVQRGSVMYLSLQAGDPLTPGYPATEGATRIPLDEAVNVPNIPSLPISYEDAEPLLHALSGEGKRASKLGPDWEGGLDLSYYTGPTEATINLVNEVKGGLHPIYNVVATIKGEIEPEREILVGNHRDAWVFGAVDPGSGSTTLLEVARTLGYLLKRGWKPRRTIKLCSWDAEEYGLIGSTEYAEDFADHLFKNAVAYINLDGFEGDRFGAEGTPSLLRLLQNVTDLVRDPSNSNRTIFGNWKENSPNQQISMRGLGSGSDYTPFYQHLGIASLNLAFSSSGSGVYHSNYDSFHFVEKFSDSNFQQHKAMTQIVGKLLAQLADLPILPFDIAQYGTDLESYISDLQSTVQPDHKDKNKKVDLAPLRKAAVQLSKQGAVIQTEMEQFQARLGLNKPLKGQPYPTCPKKDEECIKQLKSLNDRLAFLERKFLAYKGIPNREWYKHIVFAPGLWAGYQTQTFPAIKEALDDKDFKGVSKLVDEYTELINLAAESLVEVESNQS